MVKLVLRVSPIAKAAVTVACVGVGLALYGRLRHAGWANGVGSAMFFGGAVVYVIERFRSVRRRRD